MANTPLLRRLLLRQPWRYAAWIRFLAIVALATGALALGIAGRSAAEEHRESFGGKELAK